MASHLKNSLTTITFYFILLSSLSHPSHRVFSNELSEATPIKKTTHLRFFFHDIRQGKNPSAIKVSGSSYPNFFGDLYIIDNPLTESQNISSKVVGRAQGMYGYADKKEPASLMAMIFVFTQGEFNGSSISVFGRDLQMEKVREIPIVGGSGRFRYANGYTLSQVAWLDYKNNYVILKFNVYVNHY